MAEISVSEERLQRILSDFKLELYKMLRDDLAKKADAAEVTALKTQVSVHDSHASRYIPVIEDLEVGMASLRRLQNGLMAIVGLLLMVMVPVATVVLAHYLP